MKIIMDAFFWGQEKLLISFIKKLVGKTFKKILSDNNEV